MHASAAYLKLHRSASTSSCGNVFTISPLKSSMQSEKFCPHTLNSPEIYSISPFSRRRDSFCLRCKQTFSYNAGAENFFLLEQVSVSPSPLSPMSGHLTTPDPAVCLPNLTLVTQCIRVKCLRNKVFIIFCY